MSVQREDTGAVVIGRNEGVGLHRCLRAVLAELEAVVYVDSGSNDDSVASARELGVEVVELDPSRPFTAARARNEGFERLRRMWPGVEWVQFVDGDCELRSGWIPAAREYLGAHPGFAAACGRRRERRPEASPYNLLTDIEWDTPVGETDGFGGDVMIRANAFEQVGGYRADLIAGEDPELAYRLHRAGHEIMRLNHEMAWHDADLMRFDQWWRRQCRSGHAYAELAWLHRGGEDRFMIRSVVSILAWAIFLPGLALLAAAWTSGASLILLLGYPVLWLRIGSRHRKCVEGARGAWLYATACVIGKFAGLRGVLTFAWNRWILRRDSVLIEYKGAQPAGPAPPDSSDGSGRHSGPH